MTMTAKARTAGWQYLLSFVDATVAVTGVMDDITRAATEEWQRSVGIPVTGKLDPATWAASVEAIDRLAAHRPESRPAMSVGDAGEDVRYAQRRLVNLGYTVTIDGRFRPGMARALRSFQYQIGVPQSGALDEATWQALG